MCRWTQPVDWLSCMRFLQQENVGTFQNGQSISWLMLAAFAEFCLIFDALFENSDDCDWSITFMCCLNETVLSSSPPDMFFYFNHLVKQYVIMHWKHETVDPKDFDEMFFSRRWLVDSFPSTFCWNELSTVSLNVCWELYKRQSQWLVKITGALAHSDDIPREFLLRWGRSMGKGSQPWFMQHFYLMPQLSCFALILALALTLQ